MRQWCSDCGRTYNDEYCSTVCPHKGIGYCAVCDLVICNCRNDKSCPDWDRASNNDKSDPND